MSDKNSPEISEIQNRPETNLFYSETTYISYFNKTSGLFLNVKGWKKHDLSDK